MQESHIDTNPGKHAHAEANPEDHLDNYDLFMAALRNRLARKEKTQVEIAEAAGISTNYMSLIVREKRRASDEVREAIAGVFGVSLRELTNEGHLVTYGRSVEPSQPPPSTAPYPIPGVQAGHINPMDFLAAANTLVTQYQKCDERMRFWRSIFDALPVAALIIKDGTVCFQNVRSRELGTQIGGPICDTCTGTGCSDKCKDCLKKGNCEDCTCPILMAMNMAKATSGHISINGKQHMVQVTPLILPDVEYYVVVVSAVIDNNGVDRRGDMADRRQG